MEIQIIQTNHQFQFEASNGRIAVPIVASPSLSETEAGFRPMELLLASLGSCLSIDVLNILKKQRQEVKSYKVNVSGKRRAEEPAIFEHILIELFVVGPVDTAKLETAIQLSKEKYCSVYKIVSQTAEIEIKYQLNHE